MRKFNLLLICSIIASSLLAQSVAINTDGSTADPSSILDVKSTAAGVLFPRMTQAQRDVISAPAQGLMIYQTDNTSGLRVYNGTNWDIIVPAIAILSQVEAESTSGGFSVSGWQKRFLNNLDGNNIFVTLNLSDSSFTLTAGQYIIEASAGVKEADLHQIRIRGFAGAPSTEIIGSSQQVQNGFAAENRSQLMGTLSVTSDTKYALQHYIQTAGRGLGPNILNTEQNVFSIVKITKIAD